MRLIDHTNNNEAWRAKTGEANARQVADFARMYQRHDASAWAVAVMETYGHVEADHIKNVVAKCVRDGAVAVWVSDGVFAQCVWRK